MLHFPRHRQRCLVQEYHTSNVHVHGVRSETAGKDPGKAEACPVLTDAAERFNRPDGETNPIMMLDFDGD